MKIKVLIFLFVITGLISNAQSKKYIYWENLSAQQKIKALNDKKVTQYIRDCYAGKYTLDENIKQTLDLLDSIIKNKDTSLTPLYYYLFIRLNSISGGYLSEVLGCHTVKLLLREPEFIINHLQIDRLRRGNELNYFISNLAYEYYLTQTETLPGRPSFEILKEILKYKLKDSSAENKQILEILFEKTRVRMEKLLQENK
ncbi:MAG: hypothetical protein PHD97_04805 [Bacteroidales bacterium]|nr:hypothetical protein [Bacteroidales bacterium]